MQHVLRRVAARCVDTALSLALLVTLTFFLAHAAPGGPAYSIVNLKTRPESIVEVDRQLGLDVPILQQYALWWQHLLHGGLGTSYLLNRPVAAVLRDYAGNSAVLLASGLGLGVVLALLGGLAAGVWHRRPAGRVLEILAVTLYACPTFVIGSVLALLLAGILPPQGVQNLRLETRSISDTLAHLALPGLTIALVVYASLSRFFAESVHTELARPYVRTARAKGLGFLDTLWRHVVPNAVRPFVTLVGLSLPALCASLIVVESVFGYTGLGWLLWRSAVAQDYPVLVAITLVVGVFTALGNLAADIVNMVLDPRLRHG